MLMHPAPASLLSSKASDSAGFLAPFGLSLCGTQKQYHSVQLLCVPQSRTEMSLSAEPMSLKGLKD